MQNIISIIGLAIGFACFALSSLWIRYELTYDNFHKNVDLIYLAGQKTDDESGYSGISSPLLAEYLATEFPEIEHACAMRMTIHKIKGNDLPTLEIDSAFFSVLPVTLMAGSFQFLNHSNEVAITEAAARRIFGNKSPIGKSTDTGKVITAIVKDWDGHSNYPFELLTQHSNKSDRSWNVRFCYTLLQVKKGIDLTFLEKKLEEIKINLPNYQINVPTVLTPLTKLHYTHPPLKVNVSLNQIRLFAGIGLLVVLSALFNYLIIYFIRLQMRQREMTLRRVNGATTSNLMFMFGTELLLLLIGAFLIGMFLIEVSLPIFSEFSQIKQDRAFFYTESSFYLGMAALLALMLSTMIIMSKKRSILLSYGNHFSSKLAIILFNKITLCLQLIIGIGFTFCTVMVTKQIHYIFTSEDMGITHKNIGIIGNYFGIEKEAFHKCLKECPFIQAEFTNSIPLSIWGRTTYYINQWENMPENATKINAEEYNITKKTLELFDLKLIQGSIPEIDDSPRILINEKMAVALGWDKPINKKINKYTVAGVLKNVQLSAVTPANPAYYRINSEPEGGWDICVFTYQGDLKEIEENIKKRIKQDYPDFMMHCTSIQKIIEEELISERIFMQLLGISSIVCILTAAFGVFSLASLSCRQRRKEIAIRKINGATSRSIFIGFIKEDLLLLVLSALIAFPIGYACIKRWLEGFVVQVDISPWLYVYIVGGIAIILFLCIGYNVWKAAGENPAEVIKSE